MKNIKILDCTLRDGGRIINCAFKNEDIRSISNGLSESKIDLVEVGFLRNKIVYDGNSTFFTDVDQIAPFINREQKTTEFVAFIDYGMFDFETLKPYDATSIDGIRVGFVKQDFENDYDDLLRCLNIVKAKGYKLYVQGVNSLGYSDLELLKVLSLVNEIHPNAFGIVDTYGGMYVDDVQRLYTLIAHNLEEDIAIDFHSHNNFQLSFSFAQEIIKLSQGIRPIIIDATLNGMGKCAGNLNTELIVDYLVRKLNYNYDYDNLLDVIDEHIYEIKANCDWGYTIPSVMAGIYKSHPNNIIYLTEKFRLGTKDIKNIVSMISPELRQMYDYENIQKLYLEYNHIKVDDKVILSNLKEEFANKTVLVLCPGSSLTMYHEDILHKIEKEGDTIKIISVNCILEKYPRQWAFWGSGKRYKKFVSKRKEISNIVVSNVISDAKKDYVVNYDGLVSNRDNEDFDNTTILLLNLLKKLDVKHIMIAGLDGFNNEQKNYYDSQDFSEGRFSETFERTNQNMKFMLKKYREITEGQIKLEFLTQSMYEDI